MSGGLCLCDQEVDLDKPCLVCRSDPGFPVKDEPKDEEWLPFLVSDLAEKCSTALSDESYGEVMDLANMLHDLGIGSAQELNKMLGAHFDGEHWRFGHEFRHVEPWEEMPEELPAKPPIQLSDRRKAVLATRRKNNAKE